MSKEKEKICERFLEPSLFEAINYNLCIFGDVTTENNRHRALIVLTLSRLPEEVREKVLDEVTFIITSDGIQGTIFDLYIQEPKILHFILLNFSSMKRKNDSKIMDTIAHEIAHHVLGHGTVNTNPQAEREADALSETWGFKRSYRSYRQFEK